MGNIVFNQAAKFLSKRRNTRRWIAAVLCLALVVTSGTFGMLTRHGSALSGEKQLNCAFRLHEHAESCYNEAGELVCGYADFCVHQHDRETCYDSEGNLVCRLPEIEAHVHSESCYGEVQKLVCELEEKEGHQHTEDCLGIGQGNLVCEMEEHIHGENCYELVTDGAGDSEGEGSAVREAPADSQEMSRGEAPVQNQESGEDTEHTGSEANPENGESEESSAVNETPVQDGATGEEDAPVQNASEGGGTAGQEAAGDAETSRSEEPVQNEAAARNKGINQCAETRNLVCELEEHTHSGTCYEQGEGIICGLEEGSGAHVHDEACYETVQEVICGKLELHTHSEACYTDGELTCGKPELVEHVHGEECFRDAPVVELTAQVGDVIITVSAAEEGIIPAGAELSVIPVVRTEEETLETLEDEARKAEAEALNTMYDEIQQGLEESVQDDETREIKDFLAYDISFYKENQDNGTEEVKLNGEVSVRLEFPEGTLPQDADRGDAQIESVDVFDMKDTGEGRTAQVQQSAVVDTAPNAGEGSVPVQDAEVRKVETTLSDSSTIAIAWIVGADSETGIYTYENEEVLITVEPLEEDTLPKDARLKVIPILPAEDTAAEYQKVIDRLVEKAETEAYDIAGFLAYDISFLDTEDNKIEPDGSVKVTMEYKKAVIPEEVTNQAVQTLELEDGTESVEDGQQAAVTAVTVMHLEEDEAGEVARVVDMAQAGQVTELLTTEQNEIQKTEFVTDSFSTFVITWTNGQGVTYFNVKVHYVNTNGEEIQASTISHANVSLDDAEDGEISFASYDPVVSGLDYVDAHYGTYDGAVVTSYGKGQQGENPVLVFKNGEDVVETLTYEDAITEEAEVYLIYRTNHISPLTISTEEKELTKSKTVTSNGDGTYNLDLTIAGARGTKTNKVPIDILLIIDRSGSMEANGGLVAAKEAISGTKDTKGLVDIINQNEGIDARFAVVTFSSYGDSNEGYSGGTGINGTSDADGRMGFAKASKYIVPWTKNVKDVEDKVGQITASGATNYQSGIELGKEVLGEARSDAQKVVVFLTDGQPTKRLTDDKNGELGSGKKDADSWKNASSSNETAFKETYEKTTKDEYDFLKGIDETLVTTTGGNGNVEITYYKRKNAFMNQTVANAAIQGMNCDLFYAIGFGKEVTDKNLELLRDNVAAPEGAAKSYRAENSSELQGYFANIAGSVSSIFCTEVKVTDTLSDNVRITDGPFVVIKNAAGDTPNNVVGNGTNTAVVEISEFDESLQEEKKVKKEIKAIYDGKKTMWLEFPPEYQLEPGWTYQITAKIEPTEAAYEKYRKDGYTDPPTGADSSEVGLYSNDGATVTYTFDEEEHTEEYPMPVIQLNTGTLVIEKTIVGLEEAELQELRDKLSFEVTLNGTAKTYSINDFTKNEQTGKYVYTIDKLTPGTTYQVEEQNADLDGYTVTTTSAKNGVAASEAMSINGTIATAAEMILDSKNATETLSFTNEYEVNSVTIDLKKFGTSDSVPLSGAKFSLYSGTKTNDSMTWNETAVEEFDSIDVSNDEVTETAPAELTLKTGYYKLVENMAPAGYRKLEDPIYFQVDQGEVKLIDQDGKVIASAAMWNLNPEEEVNAPYMPKYTISIRNDVVYTLPSTGGIGIFWYSIGGTLLMMAGVLILYRNKIRETGRCRKA